MRTFVPNDRWRLGYPWVVARGPPPTRARAKVTPRAARAAGAGHGVAQPCDEDAHDGAGTSRASGGGTGLGRRPRVARHAGQRPGAVVGASGALGTVMVQLLSKQFKGQVTAVCSGKHAETVRKLGAHEVIDYTTKPFGEQLATAEKFAVVFDFVGGKVPDFDRRTPPQFCCAAARR